MLFGSATAKNQKTLTITIAARGRVANVNTQTREQRKQREHAAPLRFDINYSRLDGFSYGTLQPYGDRMSTTGGNPRERIQTTQRRESSRFVLFLLFVFWRTDFIPST